MGQTIYYQIFCPDCFRIRIFGKWTIINDAIANCLQMEMGKWDAYYLKCSDCQALEEAEVGHA